MAWMTVLALVAGTAAAASVHPPEIEARLEMFVGDWTLEGMEQTYRETCEWYHRRSFVVCGTTEIEGGATRHSVSVLGYSGQAKRFSYLHYGDAGTSRTETGYPTADGGLVYLRERTTETGVSHYRSRIIPIAGSRAFRFEQEKSDNGGPWESTAKLKYVLKKQ